MSVDPKTRPVYGSRRGSRSAAPAEQPHSAPLPPPEPPREQPAATVPAAPPNNVHSAAWVLIHAAQFALEVIDFIMTASNSDELDGVRGAFKWARSEARALRDGNVQKA